MKGYIQQKIRKAHKLWANSWKPALRTFRSDTLPNLLAFAGMIVGWGSILHGLYLLLDEAAVYFAGGGLFILGLVGFRFFLIIMLDGVYGSWARSQEESGGS